MSSSSRETKNLISYLCFNDKIEYFNNPQKLIEDLMRAGLNIEEVIYLFHKGLDIAILELRKSSRNSSNIFDKLKKFEYSLGENTIVFYYLDYNDYAESGYPIYKIKKFARISPNKLEIFVIGNEEICYINHIDKETECKYFHYFYLPKPVAEKFSIVLNKKFGFGIEYLKYNPINCIKNSNCTYTLKSYSENKINDNFFMEFAKRYLLTF